jgi:hypothetical protein
MRISISVLLVTHVSVVTACADRSVHFQGGAILQARHNRFRRALHPDCGGRLTTERLAPHPDHHPACLSPHFAREKAHTLRLI